MQAGERRKAILELLRQASRPLSAGYLAGRFSVSRQAVVDLWLSYQDSNLE